MVCPILCSAGSPPWRAQRLMRTRREFLTSLFSAGACGLIVACGGTAQAPGSATSAPAAPAPAATPAAAGQSAAAPTQAPAQAAGKPSAAGGTVTFVLENDVIDF